MSARSAVVAGYVALDVIRHEGSVGQSSGGTAANVAADLAYLGWRTEMRARIGADAPGRRVRHALSEAGVELCPGFLDPALQTPVVVHEVESPRHRFLFHCPSCGRTSPRFSPPDPAGAEEPGALGAPEVVFADRTSAFAAALFRRFEGEALLVLEPSTRGHATAARECAERADVLKWSHEVGGSLHPGILDPRRGQLQIETHGAAGLGFRRGREAWREMAAPTVEALDAAGAGDWLTASFLDQLPADGPIEMSTVALEDALEVSQRAAAVSCLYAGARGCAAMSPEMLQAAQAALAKSEVPVIPPAPVRRRSRAADACSLCLGPV
jgi:fructokinase